MQRFTLVTLMLGAVACSGAGGPSDGEIGGIAAAPGTSQADTGASPDAVAAPDAAEGSAASERAAATEASHALLGADRQALLPTQEPRGVVLDNGQVVNEELARNGLYPKDALVSQTRLTGSLTKYSSLKISDATTSGSVCALTMIWGVLTTYHAGSVFGSAGMSFVDVSNVGSVWTLESYPNFTGSPSPTHMAAEATCYSLSNFSAAEGGTKMISGFFEANVGGKGANTVNAWWGDAATFLTGIGGYFAGSGEYARVSQSKTSNSPSHLTIGSAQPQMHTADAHSLFVGQPGGAHTALFVGPNGVGTLSAAGEFTYNYNGSDSFHAVATKMADSSAAFCYLTQVTGNWGRAGTKATDPDPWVQIFMGSDFKWYLLSWAPAGANVNAIAACYKTRQ